MAFIFSLFFNPVYLSMKNKDANWDVEPAPGITMSPHRGQLPETLTLNL